MRTLLWIFAVIGLLTSVLFAMVIVIGLRAMHPKVPVIAGDSILTVDLTKSYSEAPPPPGLATLVEEDKAGTFRELTSTIRRAAFDDRVKALIARTGEGTLGLAQIEELRDAIAVFRARKKPAYVFAESFGELSSGTGPYFLASAFDEIWLQPIGSVGLVGISLQMPFLKGILDKVGVTADFSRRGAFKSAETELTETKLPESDRQAFQGLAQSLSEQIVQGIAAGRHIDAAAAKALIDNGPYTGTQALAAHLVDHIGYRDELEQTVRAKLDSASLIGIGDYRKALAPETGSGTSIALIYATGIVASGTNGTGALGAQMGSDDLVKALHDAAGQPQVKAIVLRIDSPGGSDVASEAIWRATQLARQGGKPLVVSMGDEAASGGYYIACGADRIVAEPGTLTGSIGIFGGKFVLAGLWDKIGVTWDGVQFGRNADIGSNNTLFTPEQRQHFGAMLDEGYTIFKSRVAAGRHLDPAKVEEIAQGHVWTGAQALGIGLVDEIGGLREAIVSARKLAHIEPSETVSIETFPKEKNFFRELLKNLTGKGGMPVPLNSSLAADLGQLAKIATMMTTLTGGNGAAIMRPVEVSR